MSKMLQCDATPPAVYCETCGRVGLKTRFCDHQFQADAIVCDYSGIWQRKQVEGLYTDRVSLVASHLPNSEWRDKVDLHYFRDPRHLASILSVMQEQRLRSVATHNYGNRTPLHVLSALPEAVLVVHDLHHLGFAERPGTEPERVLVARAKRIVFPSQAMADSVAHYLQPDARILVQHQRVPLRYFRWRTDPEGAIFQGRLSDSWGNVFRRIREAGHVVNVLPSIVSPSDDYARFGDIKPTRFYSKVLDSCAASRWGLTGNPSINSSMGRSMSNKFWDYLASGCIPLVLHHPSVAEVVREIGVGVVAESVERLLEIVSDESLWQQQREALAKVPVETLAMEGQREAWGAFLCDS